MGILMYVPRYVPPYVLPFDAFGTPYKIVHNIFGGREKYLAAAQEIQTALYAS